MKSMVSCLKKIQLLTVTFVKQTGGNIDLLGTIFSSALIHIWCSSVCVRGGEGTTVIQTRCSFVLRHCCFETRFKGAICSCKEEIQFVQAETKQPMKIFAH